MRRCNLQALGKSGEDATEIIREFGNALALSGTAPRELNQVVNAIRQMSGEGKILQEDIAILTTRVAALGAALKGRVWRNTRRGCAGVF